MRPETFDLTNAPQGITSICADFLVGDAGIEPATLPREGSPPAELVRSRRGLSRLALLGLRLQKRPTRPIASPALSEVLERLAGLDENRPSPLAASYRHNYVDIERVELDTAANAAGLVGGDEVRA